VGGQASLPRRPRSAGTPGRAKRAIRVGQGRCSRPANSANGKASIHGPRATVKQHGVAPESRAHPGTRSTGGHHGMHVQLAPLEPCLRPPTVPMGKQPPRSATRARWIHSPGCDGRMVEQPTTRSGPRRFRTLASASAPWPGLGTNSAGSKGKPDSGRAEQAAPPRAGGQGTIAFGPRRSSFSERARTLPRAATTSRAGRQNRWATAGPRTWGRCRVHVRFRFWPRP